MDSKMNAILSTTKKSDQKKDKNKNLTQNPVDSRKRPASDYPEENPISKKNIQDYPENQNSG